MLRKYTSKNVLTLSTLLEDVRKIRKSYQKYYSNLINYVPFFFFSNFVARFFLFSARLSSAFLLRQHVRTRLITTYCTKIQLLIVLMYTMQLFVLRVKLLFNSNHNI